MHWLLQVARKAELSGADHAPVTPATPAAEAWEAVRQAAGITTGDLARIVAEHVRLPVADLAHASPRALRLVPETVVRRHAALPLREDQGCLIVATCDPMNLDAEQALSFASGRTVVFEIAAPEMLREAIAAAYAPLAQAVPAAAARPTDPMLSVIRATPVRAATGGMAAVSARRTPFGGSAAIGARPAEAGAPRILVVDDDIVTRKLACALLKRAGYEVSEAEDGALAMRQLDSGIPFSLVVLDLDMPRLGGHDVLARVRSGGKAQAVPIIVLTGMGNGSIEVLVMENGADDYIQKPIDPARFLARVKAAIRRAAAA